MAPAQLGLKPCQAATHVQLPSQPRETGHRGCEWLFHALGVNIPAQEARLN